MTPREHVLALLRWTPWQPLRGAWLADRLPNLPGLYRIRRIGHDDLNYIGQTGAGDMSLKKRLGMLRGSYADEMPYRDPHTAGPGLWALRHATSCVFEVSVTAVEGSTSWRKGLECVAISRYREEHQQSPTIEFGRMPPGYRISSGNTARLVAAGQRFRGGLFDGTTESQTPSIAPIAPLVGDPLSLTWCGHRWSPWMPIQDGLAGIPPSGANGLYRLRRVQDEALLYIGQGHVSARLAAHVRRVVRPSERQADLLAGDIECSWVLDAAWHMTQRLELENDLIAAYVLETATVPPAQFLG
jgi:hypothetical protein